MPTSSGPNTLGESNLVFAYDTGDVSNSYRGEPTTNLVIAPDGNANVITADVPFGVNVSGYAQYSDRYSVNPRNTTNIAATGNTFTYSVWMRSRTATPSTYLMYVYTGTGPDGGWYYFGDGPLTSQWTRYSYTRSDMAGTVSIATVYRHNQQGTIEIAAPQLEVKSHATQFVNGTRSATQGLLPLVGNSTIDLTNVSFDSNAKMTFDGTNDYTNLGNLGTIGANYTIECVFNSSQVTSYRNIFDMNYATYSGVTGNVGPRLEQETSAGINIAWSGVTNNNSLYNYTTPIAISANTWYHVVFTQNSTAGAIYLNGVYRNQGSNTNGYVQTFSDANLGRGFQLTGDRYFTGTLPVFKIYNKALTAQEVRQNYQQYKTRFNLS
jgi:hypothetical protein